MADARASGGIQGFKEAETRVEGGEEPGLQLALGIFFGRLAVADDAGADTQGPGARRQGGIRDGRGAQGEGADGDRQAEVATGGCWPVRRPGSLRRFSRGIIHQANPHLIQATTGSSILYEVWPLLRFIFRKPCRCGWLWRGRERRVDPADGAGIEPPGPRFELPDPVHGAQLGGAGDGAAGEGGAQHLGEGHRGWQFRLDGGGHLPQAGMGLQLEQGRHPHAAGARQAPEVVAQQVDDHQVFGPGLGIGAQLTRQGGIPRRSGAAGGRTLHGARLEQTPVVAQEEFRGAGQDPGRFAARGGGGEGEEGAVRHRLARP